MTHLAEGMRRRLVDEPAAVTDTDRRHAQICARCQSAVEAARADRDAVAELLAQAAGTEPLPDVETAWGRLTEPTRRAADPVRGVAVSLPRRRLSLRRPMVAVSAAAVLALGGTAAAAAASWLPIFHPRAVTPVTFQVTDLAGQLPDLSAYGTLSVPGHWQPRPAASASAATAAAGIPAPTVAALPAGVTGTPTYAVLPRRTVTFTFSADKAATAAARHGRSLPAMPAGLDGSRLRLDVGPGVVATWDQGGRLPTLAVVRMKAPTAASEGVSLQTLEDFLVAQPGFPAGLANQIRALPTNGSVLPVPVPTEVATSEATQVHGHPATLLRLRDQSAAALVWISDGRLEAAVGLLSPDNLRAVARGLG